MNHLPLSACELPTFINSSVVEGKEDVHEKSLDFEGFETNGEERTEKTREMRDDDWQWHGTGMAGSSVTHFMFPADNFALCREWPRTANRTVGPPLVAMVTN